MKRTGGLRRKTRSKLAKNIREKGKISIVRYMQEFKEGDSVCLKAEPSMHKGMFPPRYYGKSAIVKGKRGRCYMVQIKDCNKTKTLIVHPVHLRSM